MMDTTDKGSIYFARGTPFCMPSSCGEKNLNLNKSVCWGETYFS